MQGLSFPLQQAFECDNVGMTVCQFDTKFLKLIFHVGDACGLGTYRRAASDRFRDGGQLPLHFVAHSNFRRPPELQCFQLCDPSVEVALNIILTRKIIVILNSEVGEGRLRFV